jgi:hypothetical protein
MLVGYLVAPHAIWHLCVATHAATPRDDVTVNIGSQPSAALDRGITKTFHQPCKEKTS